MRYSGCAISFENGESATVVASKTSVGLPVDPPSLGINFQPILTGLFDEWNVPTKLYRNGKYLNIIMVNIPGAPK